MDGLEIALPASILALAFILKLVVDRTATVPDFITALIGLPVDIAFLATSLIAAFAIADRSQAPKALVVFVLYIVGSVVAVFLWRRSLILFFADRYGGSVVFAALGYVLCGSGLLLAIGFVSGAIQ